MIESIVESFTNNLIVEDRYRMILDGLQVTLLITLFAAVLGTILGGLVCWMRMSRHDIWKKQTAIPEKLRRYIVDCCKKKEMPADMQQLMKENVFK